LNATNVILTSDFTGHVNAQLAVGNIAETVSVVAESPSVDIQSAKVQYVFKGDDIADLPTERDLGGLLNLVPSVTTTREDALAASERSVTVSPPRSTHTFPRWMPMGRNQGPHRRGLA
jgi:hypothetical protein